MHGKCLTGHLAYVNHSVVFAVTMRIIKSITIFCKFPFDDLMLSFHYHYCLDDFLTYATYLATIPGLFYFQFLLQITT